MSEFRVRLRPAQLRSARKAMAKKPTLRALRKASSTSIRDMKSEASKRIRARKRLKVRDVRKAMVVERARGRISNFAQLSGFKIKFKDTPVPLINYPHSPRLDGVSVAVNRGARTVVKSAFIATMKSGHKGIFKRKGRKRLPIRELFGSRPVDALLHEGEAEAVAKRGRESLQKAFLRLLPLEMDKG